MKGLILCVFAIMMLTPAQGSGEDEEQLMESVGFEEEEEFLECFRCDLGFWDACYTTKTNCSLGERCYTGRGKAGHALDIKTLGCVRAEECGTETSVELFSNKTIFAMTKHCCDTPFCNSAHKLQITTLSYLTVAVLTTWHLTEASTGS
ncbi:protein Bouncer-like isoform X2 [Chaetodon trifascialis]|uniref:protein Bouncer-like isoform X2 n=1 Tax=Chaetodon trifascialis TaxID=109706 RepID=UPI003994AA34